jgi:hypothetical protein
MQRVTLFAALLLLAACGVDGAPKAPDAPATGVSVSGDMRMGVTGGL